MKKPLNSAIETILTHRSIRKFKDESIDEDILDKLLECGVRAPTAGNLQHYSLVVIRDDEKKKKFPHPETYKSAILIISLIDEYRRKRWLELNNAEFHYDRNIDYSIANHDALIALHNILIAAESIGLGGYYIGNILSLDISKLLEIPEYVSPAGMLWLGYPDEEPDLKKRLPNKGVIHREKYQIYSDRDIKEIFSDLDSQWPSIKEKYKKNDVENTAQYISKYHYSKERMNELNLGYINNLKHSKFDILDQSNQHQQGLEADPIIHGNFENEPQQ